MSNDVVKVNDTGDKVKWCLVSVHVMIYRIDLGEAIGFLHFSLCITLCLLLRASLVCMCVCVCVCDTYILFSSNTAHSLCIKKKNSVAGGTDAREPRPQSQHR